MAFPCCRPRPGSADIPVSFFLPRERSTRDPEITFFNGLNWSREMAEACAGIGLGLAVGQGHAGGGMLGRPMVSCEIGTRTINAFGESGPLLRPENPIELAGAMLCVEKDETLAKD